MYSAAQGLLWLAVACGVIHRMTKSGESPGHTTFCATVAACGAPITEAHRAADPDMTAALTPSTLPGGPSTLFANNYYPLAQRNWIALETKRLLYQYVEVMSAHMQGGRVDRPQELLEICPEGIQPCLKHGKLSSICLPC